MPSSGRIILMATAAAVAVLVLYALYSTPSLPGTVTSPVPTSFAVNGRTYTFTYIATTQPEREAGLMNKHVTNTTTMLFAFPSAGHWQFWMYNTPTSLDMIWISASGNSGRVIYLVTGAVSCYDRGSCTVYTPTADANYVIEAKAGFAETSGISVGSIIQFS